MRAIVLQKKYFQQYEPICKRPELTAAVTWIKTLLNKLSSVYTVGLYKREFYVYNIML